MQVREGRTRPRGGWWSIAAVLGLALALGCAGSSGPDTEDGGPVGGGDLGGGSIEEEGIAGRTVEGTEAARRMGLRTVYFDFDKSAIRADQRDDLRHNYDVLRGNPRVRVELQGNADERGSAEYNFALGERRARAVKDYLMQLGIDGGRMQTVSFGEENPAVMGHNERAWSQNRRVEFAVLP